MKKHYTVQDVIQAMHQLAPPELALQGDVIGLQIGSKAAQVQRVWVALEATPAVVAAAAKAEVDLIVTHHAILFRPLTHIDLSQPRHAAIQTLLSSGIAVFSAHTNLDVAPGGVNDVIADKLGLTDIDILDVTREEALFKLVVYAPDTHSDAVRSAITDAGAGAIGNYAHCTFSTEGTGTFMPGIDTSPFIGQQGEHERVHEQRIETVVPKDKLSTVLEAMETAHPYEEVAYDLFRLEQPAKKYGIGRIGTLPQPMTLPSFAKAAKEVFGMAGIRYAGDEDREIRRVAVLGGSGSKWIAKSLAKGADVLVTADIGHHDAADASQDGIAVVDVTHAALEQPVCDAVVAHLRQALGEGSIAIERAPIDVDPFRWQ